MRQRHPVQVDENIHKLLKQYSTDTGIKIKFLVEMSIVAYLKTIQYQKIADRGKTNG